MNFESCRTDDTLVFLTFYCVTFSRQFIMANPHLLQDLTDRGLWNPAVRNQLMRDSGSVANINCIPERLKELYKTVCTELLVPFVSVSAHIS